MAAKVVMVAVPTVLGIASIRVYRVSEVPADGLITREKLNIYTPVTPTTQAQFVPDQPGVIESSLTTARETVLPLVQAVKGACVSVKTGTINLYHTGEDVYYYLKDPPPGFLPRYGTITMAGLLGMFLARRGSRVKRIALPLGLMGVAGSVCYPAQTVAVFKVTGKKMYAAGQWSSAAVSSLFTSKSQEPVAKEIAASPPQAAPVPNPESAAAEEAQSAPCHASEPSSDADSSVHSAAISETQMESAESVPASDEPIIAVTTEKPSETYAEISADEAPTHSDLQAASVPADTGIAPPAETLPAPAESEAQGPSTQASEDASGPEPSPVEVPSPSQELPAPEPPLESVPVDVPTSSEEPPSPEPQMEPSPIEVPSPSLEPPAPLDEPPALEVAVEPTVPVVDTAESGAAAQPELADGPPSAAATEETLIPTHTPPPTEQPAAKTSKGGSGFKADPALMDFGQSNPEDEDLYSTRS